MTVNTYTFKTYTIDEHPHPEKVYDWVRDHWHDLGEHDVQEAVASLEAYCKEVDATLDYGISIVPDRGEFVEITGADPELVEYVFVKSSDGDCPLTGVFYDDVIIEASANGLDQIGPAILKALHAEGEHIYSDEGIHDLCEANDYEFKTNGEFFSPNERSNTP